MMQHPAWAVVAIGLVIAAVGILWLISPSIPWLGRLPGDIRYDGENTKIFIPITTCILLSLLLSAIMWVMRRVFR